MFELANVYRLIQVLIFFFQSKEKMMRGVRRGCVRLRAAVVGIDDEDDSNFTITVDHKTFHFQVILLILSPK